MWHRLNHPYVLKFYGACHADKRHFVCKFASNGELRTFLGKPGSEHLIWEKMHEVVLGLEDLHGRISSTTTSSAAASSWRGRRQLTKLIDFGLSCSLNEAEIQIEVNKMRAMNWRSREYLAGE